MLALRGRALEGVRCRKWRWRDSHGGNAVEANCLVLCSLASSRSLHLDYMQVENKEPTVLIVERRCQIISACDMR